MSAIPLSVVTGFLGSGKTTLVAALLRRPELADTAVIVNEFGTVGLDHLLVKEVLDEGVVLLSSGCLCCTVRGALAEALRDLYLKRVQGSIPEFRRVLVETSGLADPAPVVHTLMRDPMAGAYYRLDGIVACVDTLFGADQLERHPESLRQVALADRLVVTKTDLAPFGRKERLAARLSEINPAAPVLVADHGDVDPAAILEAGLFGPASPVPDLKRWLNPGAYGAARHTDGIASFCLTLDRPVDWTAFSAWMNDLLAVHGEKVLRIKGMLRVVGEDRPFAIHGINHLFHPPQPLPPEAGLAQSTLVFIVQGLAREAVENSLRISLAAAR
ncbi:MAG: GTP-binding protein [Magnetospirillum sp. WYHS-4]